MWIGVISLFPNMFNSIINYGVISRAIHNGLLNLQCWNPREFTCNKYRTVDKPPYGGGSGMILMGQPFLEAIKAAKKHSGRQTTKVIYLSPQGNLLNQYGVKKILNNQRIILVCGRYKGIDERLIDIEIDEEWSIGDYILTGGELPAMVIIDSISRLIPGVLGRHVDSINEDSFTHGLLSGPQYTRPKVFNNIKVPQILLSGHHAKIRRWRLKQSLGRTWIRRPELLQKIILDDEQKKLLIEFQTEYQESIV